MAGSEVSISFEESDSKGRYLAKVAGHVDRAELTFSKAGDTMIIVDHTDVPDTLRGLGIGVLLAERAVEDARAAGLKIIPLCPFFKAQAMKHQAWQDVVRL